MKNKIINLALLFLLWAGPSWAQCSNGPCYTTNGPQVNWMMPEQAAKLGQTTATITAYAGISGSMASHNLTITTGPTQSQGLCTGFKFHGYNGASATAYFTLNGGATRYSQGPWSPVSGDTGLYWCFTANDWGSTRVMTYVVTGTDGSTSQDQATVKVVAGTGPSISFQDQIPTNFIVQLSLSGGGGSMLNDFTMCQGGNQQHCINATHTPYTTLILTNQTSGEVQSHPKHQSGNMARANESVSFSDSIFISANSLDQLNYEEDDVVICSLSGPIGVAGGGSSPVSVEWAWTVVQKLPSPPCEQVPGGGIRCYMQYACTPDSSPPDYRPVQIFTLQFGTVDMPDYWLSGNLCFSIFGAPYLCPGSQIAGGIPGSGDWWKFVLAPGIPWTNKPFECTKASAGKGVTIPWPF